MRRFGLFILLLVMLGSFSASAAPLHRTQAWSILRYQKNLKESFFGGQLQNRYDFRTERGFEEQLNLYYGQDIGNYQVDFIFTVGTIETYKELRELRYAAEIDREFPLSGRFSYDLRLRYEARDFRRLRRFAHRFRLRNAFSYNPDHRLFDRASLSGEFNFYLNDYEPEASGFSSYRTILGCLWVSSWGEWGLAYLNDYRKGLRTDEVRHVLLWTLELDS